MKPDPAPASTAPDTTPQPGDERPLNTTPPLEAATLTVQPLGRTVPVAAGHSLLQAAAAGGLHLPSSCRNGTCRACICRLMAGQVTYRIDWPGLSREEKAEGWVLPCVAVCSGAVTLHVPDAIALLKA